MTRAKSEPAAREASAAETEAYRLKQADVSTALEKVFGPFKDSQPHDWEQRAFLHLVGLVYTRLSTSESPIPTDELASLAKLLGERRAGAKDHKAARSTRPGESFAEIVREVYGLETPVQKEG